MVFSPGFFKAKQLLAFPMASPITGTVMLCIRVRRFPLQPWGGVVAADTGGRAPGCERSGRGRARANNRAFLSGLRPSAELQRRSARRPATPRTINRVCRRS